MRSEIYLLAFARRYTSVTFGFSSFSKHQVLKNKQRPNIKAVKISVGVTLSDLLTSLMVT